MIEGGCLCGAVRYELDEPALGTTACHCRDCQKAGGSPVMVWTFFREGALRWSVGRARKIAFAGRERSFCRDCGTPLMFFDPALPHLFEVSTASLDEPGKFPPIDQCWTKDRMPWFGGIHKLSEYGENAPLPEVP